MILSVYMEREAIMERTLCHTWGRIMTKNSTMAATTVSMEPPTPTVRASLRRVSSFLKARSFRSMESSPSS